MIIREKVRVGNQIITLETGRIAKQAQGAVLVSCGESVVLVTACGTEEARPGQSFLPLSVDYVEKTYAAGKIPGGFFKREGRLRDAEVLTSRLIDRPCRPLFPDGYRNEIQVMATVMSHDLENPPDVLAMIGASAALHISPIPWAGPIAGVRVGRVDGELIANPTYAELEESDCDLLIAASRDAIVMVEGEADEMNEQDMIEALYFGHEAVQDTLDLIERMREAVGHTKWSFEPPRTPPSIEDRVRDVALAKVKDACTISEKHARYGAFKRIKKETVAELAEEFQGQEDFIKATYEELRYNTMRAQVLYDNERVDGRDSKTVRPISIELGMLPRVHGTSLFTRGETQAIVTATLGTARDEQRLDALTGDSWKRFLLHYNFPAYSVGEVKMLRGPGRREVGHGNLAERALAKMIPSKEEFPYTIRIVSEITESNGSSSMATVCGGSLAMMDAGIPIRTPVAGVAMGLIKEGPDYAILTDILGDEDHLGDMDFKVCGTDRGVTAIQMDIKIEGLSREIMERALKQAREARLHILDKMAAAIREPRAELSSHAPRITQIRVKPDQIRTIIGPGGKMIKAIVDQTGVSIDVQDDGTVLLASPNQESVEQAMEIIKGLTSEPEVGEIYEGTVRRVEPYGAFLEIMSGKDGLLHISDIDWHHVSSVDEYMTIGDKVAVKVTNIDRDGRIRLSRKDALPDAKEAREAAEARDADRPRGRDRDRDRPRDRDEERRPRGRRGEERKPRARGRDEEEVVEPATEAKVEREPVPERDELRGRGARGRDDEDRPRRRGRDDEDRPRRRSRDDERPRRRGRDDEALEAVVEESPRARRVGRDDEALEAVVEESPRARRVSRGDEPREAVAEERPRARRVSRDDEDRPRRRSRDDADRPRRRSRDDEPRVSSRRDDDERPSRSRRSRDDRDDVVLADEEERPRRRGREDRDEIVARDDDRPPRPRRGRPERAARDEERPERPRRRGREDRDEIVARDRDEERPARPRRSRAEREPLPALDEEPPRPRRARSEQVPEEDEPRSRRSRARDEGARTTRRGRDDEEGARTRRGRDDEDRPRRRNGRDDRDERPVLAEDEPREGRSRDREDRVERDQPSRSRLRSRERVRARERERELERDRRG